MHRFLIERELPAIGRADARTLREAAERSNEALAELGHEIQWVESFVCSDRTFCVYLAQDEELIRLHADRSGFPALRIHEVARVIDPTTASTIPEPRG